MKLTRLFVAVMLHCLYCILIGKVLAGGDCAYLLPNLIAATVKLCQLGQLISFPYYTFFYHCIPYANLPSTPSPHLAVLLKILLPIPNILFRLALT